MKWLLLMSEEGEGCDYTIGCGVAYEMIEAESREEALEVAREKLDDRSLLDPDGERQLEVAYLLPADGDIVVPSDEWIAERQAKKDIAKKAEVEAQEMAELERLKSKYG